MPAIDTSFFDLFKIGPGPSSSHTIGPMKAGYDFIQAARALEPQRLAQASGLEVRLYGSLSATGKGHGTDRAVLAGLLGRAPEACPPQFLDELAASPLTPRPLDLGPARLAVSAVNIIFDAVDHDFPCNNTLVIRLLGPPGRGECLFAREYYSVGGGFIHYKGQPEERRGQIPYPYATMEELKKQLVANSLSLHQLALANEMALTGADEAAVLAGLDTVLGVMDAAVTAGLVAEGVLPGSIGLQRKAKKLFERSKVKTPLTAAFLTELCACAFACSEENAAGHVIVTAPTCGAAGVIPAVARIMRTRLGHSDVALRQGLMAAAVIGFLAKHNATIAGAEGGCQAEVGVASAMAAAMLSHAAGHNWRITENAAQTALEHHLGMTCDPVGGYVQIPCIERNAMAAVKAYSAFCIASDEVPAHHKVGLDQTLLAMLATGRDMNRNYKETAQGGLAVFVAAC